MRIVKFELKALERLMPPGLNARSLGWTTMVSTQHELSLDNLRSEVDRIRSAFLQEGLVFKDELHLKRYVQHHQYALVEIMDEAFRAGAALQTGNSTPVDFYFALESLLSFIEKNFNLYFDLDAKAPLTFINAARENALRFMNTANELFPPDRCDVDLVDILFHGLRRLTGPDVSKVSFRTIRFALTLQDQLHRISRKATTAINEDLLQLIYFVNYNTIRSFLYHTRLVTSVLSKDQTRHEQIEQLSILLKKINQAPVCAGIVYNPKAPPLKTQLSDYILEEIAHLERLGVSVNNVGSNVKQDNFRLALDLSVSQLAFMIRIFYEMKIIKNKNISDVIRFLTRFVTTSKAESLSFDSMRTKFYTIETVTRVSFRKVLTGAIRYIDDDDS